MTALIRVRPVQVSAGALCLGLASANGLRPGSGLLAVALLALAVAFGLNDVRRIVAVAVALALFGLWWGAARLDALDASSLAGRIGTAARVRLVVTAPLQRGRYELRGPAVVIRFGEVDADEPALLRLPPGRAPPKVQSSRASAPCMSRAAGATGSTSARGFDARASMSCYACRRCASSADAAGLVGLRTGFVAASRAASPRAFEASARR